VRPPQRSTGYRQGNVPVVRAPILGGQEARQVSAAPDGDQLGADVRAEPGDDLEHAGLGVGPSHFHDRLLVLTDMVQLDVPTTSVDLGLVHGDVEIGRRPSGGRLRPPGARSLAQSELDDEPVGGDAVTGPLVDGVVGTAEHVSSPDPRLSGMNEYPDTPGPAGAIQDHAQLAGEVLARWCPRAHVDIDRDAL
jgi:hypothetical protein